MVKLKCFKVIKRSWHIQGMMTHDCHPNSHTRNEHSHTCDWPILNRQYRLITRQRIYLPCCKCQNSQISRACAYLHTAQRIHLCHGPDVFVLNRKKYVSSITLNVNAQGVMHPFMVRQTLQGMYVPPSNSPRLLML